MNYVFGFFPYSSWLFSVLNKFHDYRRPFVRTPFAFSLSCQVVSCLRWILCGLNRTAVKILFSSRHNCAEHVALRWRLRLVCDVSSLLLLPTWNITFNRADLWMYARCACAWACESKHGNVCGRINAYNSCNANDVEIFGPNKLLYSSPPLPPLPPLHRQQPVWPVRLLVSAHAKCIATIIVRM